MKGTASCNNCLGISKKRVLQIVETQLRRISNANRMAGFKVGDYCEWDIPFFQLFLECTDVQDVLLA